jgi:hypothetical protein
MCEIRKGVNQIKEELNLVLLEDYNENNKK